MDNSKHNVELPLLLDETTLPIITQVADAMSGGFFIYRADGDEELLFCNRAMPRIFGCTSMEEFRQHTGNSFKGIVHPEDYERVELSIAKQIESSSFNLDYVEYRIIRKDGSIRLVEDYGHFVHTKQYGDIYYVFIDDATDRVNKRAMELQEINDELSSAYGREKQYKKAILHDAVSFFEINLTRDEFITTAVQVVNEQNHDLFELLGIKPFKRFSEFVEYWSKNISPDDMEKYREFFRIDRLLECYERGEYEVSCDLKMSNSFGKRRYCRNIFLLGKNEQTNNVIGLFLIKDTTENNETHRLLQIAMGRAEAASNAKQAFLNSMSHDIRTPLNAILGYMDLIESNAYDPEIVLDYIGKMKMSGKQLLAIITESMDVTKMEAGKMRLTESQCSLTDLVTDVINSLKTDAAVRGITLRYDIDGISHPVVTADSMRMTDILLHLLDNALKYTDRGGTVDLKVSETKSVSNDVAKYVFVVSDTGCGMSKEFLERVFEPFERENDTTVSGVHGTGLGLTVVRGLVGLMNGTIDVKSEPNVGSTFTVSVFLRHSEEQEQTVEPPLYTPYSLEGKRILLTDDNEINMEIASELLREQGFIVDTADNGKIALDKVTKNPVGTYDIILMDIQMPVMNGYEAAKAIRALDDPLLSQIPIIAVSANTFAEDREKAIESGMNAHFPKPIDIKNLCSLIGRILARGN